MTLQQIKEEVAGLSDADRLALQAFLIHLDRVNDPFYRQETGDRTQRLEAGSGVSLDEFVRLNPWENSPIV